MSATNCSADFKDEKLARAQPWVLNGHFQTKSDPKITKLYANLGVKVVTLPEDKWKSIGPAYNASGDAIGKLPSCFYPNREVLSAVQLHELVHWTGHFSRLARRTLGMSRELLALPPDAVDLLEESIAELASIELQKILEVKKPEGEFANLSCARLASYRARVPNAYWEQLVEPMAQAALDYIKREGGL